MKLPEQDCSNLSYQSVKADDKDSRRIVGIADLRTHPLWNTGVAVILPGISPNSPFWNRICEHRDCATLGGCPSKGPYRRLVFQEVLTYIFSLLKIPSKALDKVLS